MREKSLFDPIKLGALSLSNRIVMPPMTRSRALADGRPGPSAPLYYAQRASAGLIIAEGAAISPEGVADPDIPGLWSAAQVQAWKPITEAVHEEGGTIVGQLWHAGRASHPTLQPDGKTPVGPSPVAVSGFTSSHEGPVPYVTPRALETSEIPAIVEQYAVAAGNAREAGFDGVELHAANGYLIDQFLHDSANQRRDRYGGSIEHRSRLLLEVVDALVDVVGADRVGVRFSPSSTYQDMTDTDPMGLYAYVFEALAPRGLAYVHLVEPRIAGDRAATESSKAPNISSSWARNKYHGRLIGAGGYNRERALRAVEKGSVDAVAFGRPFLANPDLPTRLAVNAPLNKWQRDSFYGGDDHGYLDYPSLEAERFLADLRAKRLAPTPDLQLNSETPLKDWHLAWAHQHLIACL